MNLTLHLTENCNLDCTYCIRHKRAEDMSEAIVDKCCEMIFASGKSAGITFFGGEPLLRKDLIFRTLDRCEQLSKTTGKRFACKMTTNGILLDEEFLERARHAKMGVAISFDGLAQNKCRCFPDGSKSFDLIEEKARLLLRYLPKSYAMMTIAPEAAEEFAESVKYLYELGFRRINATIAYGKKVQWTESKLDIIKEQFQQIAVFYKACFEKDYFYFGPFDGKISDAISGKNPKERCHLGTRQMPVAVDGKIYACTQFIGDEEYCLGNVFTGFDKAAMASMAKKSEERKEPEDCENCDFRERCTHTCGCTNRMESGNEDIVSATTCLYEQMIIKMADAVATDLYKKCPEIFEQRF